MPKIKPTLFFDLDNTLVNFQSGVARLCDADRKEYAGHYDEVPGIFKLMDPMPGAVETVRKLSKHFDVYILSTAPWGNNSAWTDKVEWVKRYFSVDEEGRRLPKEENPFYKKIILTHAKGLVDGDILVDDTFRIKSDRIGSAEFRGRKIWLCLPGVTEARCDAGVDAERCESYSQLLDLLMPKDE